MPGAAGPEGGTVSGKGLPSGLDRGVHAHTMMPSVGLLTIEIYIPGVTSLKQKRGVVLPLVSRLRKQFNVSVAEIADQDQLGHTVLGVASVSPSADYVHALLTRVAESVAAWRLDAEIVNYRIDLL